MENRIYACIDLKSFYASVECVERGLDPFTENLVVADPDRTEATICLAISPAMKAKGVKNRCRVFEIPKSINYVMARPRMKLYMEKSIEIYSCYLNYISPDDILVYSIDECFFDLTDYIKLYGKSGIELAKFLTEKVYEKTGIRAAAGVGTNLFLSKVALDITAKRSKDFIGYLDEEKFKKEVWHHKPLTDIWNIGSWIEKRLNKHGLFDLYDVAHYPEEPLYKEFGINAELIIDHAKGIEPCTISDIKNYSAKNYSLSNSQILFEDYTFSDAETILREMVDGIVLDLVDKGLVTNGISLSIGYSDKTHPITGKSLKLSNYSNSYKEIIEKFLYLYNETTDKNQKIKRLAVGLNNVVPETYLTYDLLTDINARKKEKNLQKAVIEIKEKFGKNSILKGVSYNAEGTARERNKMIGGHNAGENE